MATMERIFSKLDYCLPVAPAEVSNLNRFLTAMACKCVDVINRKQFFTNDVSNKNKKIIDCSNCCRKHTIKRCPAFDKS